MLIPLLLSLLAAPQTAVISQEFSFEDLNILQDVSAFHVDPFPVSEGNLLDVRVVVTYYKTRHAIRVTNTSNEYYPSNVNPWQDWPSTQVGVVPWLHSGDHRWSQTSYNGTWWHCGDHYWWVIPPNSATVTYSGCQSWPGYEREFGLITPMSPDVGWWTDAEHPVGIDLEYRPRHSKSIVLVDKDGGPDKPWPGDGTVLEYELSMTYRLEYEYEPW